MTDDICGEVSPDTGKICELPSGWGRDADDGPCKWHGDVKPVPPKLTEQLIVDMEADLRHGHSYRGAAAENGISETTHNRWLNWAEDLSEDDTSERAELLRAYRERTARAHGAGDYFLEDHFIDAAVKRGDANALLRYLKQRRGGEDSQTDDELPDESGLTTEEKEAVWQALGDDGP